MNQSDKLLSGLFDQLSFALCIVTNDFIITRANEYFESRVIHEGQSVVGCNILELFPEYAGFLKRKINTAFVIESASFSSWEQTPHVLPFKSSRPVSGKEQKMFQNMEVFPLFDDDEIVRQVCLCVYDVTTQAVQQLELRRVSTELKQEHEALLELNQKLKDTQGQLIQSEKMASIGQLSAGIAHEINNPLGFITSNIRTLSDYFDSVAKTFDNIAKQLENSADSELKQQYDELLETVDMDYILSDTKDLIEESLEGSDRVMSIVKNLRDFSHLDGSEWSLASLVDCIESTLKIVSNEIKYKMNVSTEFEQDVPEVFCQPRQINQVLLNLFVNASQATEKHGSMSISLSKLNEDHVQIKVADTGSGIPEDIIKRIFDPFFTTKDVGSGTGLGLSVSYGIIKSHNGKISVESEVGKGTTFTVVLPIQNQPPENL